VTAPANFRAVEPLQAWLAERGKIGLSGIDTRALTRRIRLLGAPNAVIAHDPDGQFDIPALIAEAKAWPGLEGMDLARVVSRESQADWEGGIWRLGQGYARSPRDARPHVVAVDYGAKDNIFRNLVRAGARVTVVPAETALETVLSLEPAGVFLSNGPGDPAATGVYAVPLIQGLLERDIPVFGICLGHQMLGLAAGAKTVKMHQGHRGANHPVKRHTDGVVEITSMNHGFAVDNAALPEGVVETHVSLFDGSNCGIEIAGRRAFGVQYHPEASPGPQDSFYLFEKFVGMLG
jgi:carbamoyl-phosphate synthase small subunit